MGDNSKRKHLNPAPCQIVINALGGLICHGAKLTDTTIGCKMLRLTQSMPRSANHQAQAAARWNQRNCGTIKSHQIYASKTTIIVHSISRTNGNVRDVFSGCQSAVMLAVVGNKKIRTSIEMGEIKEMEMGTGTIVEYHQPPPCHLLLNQPQSTTAELGLINGIKRWEWMLDGKLMVVCRRKLIKRGRECRDFHEIT